MEKLDVEAMEDFWEELPTNQCGDLGCDACVRAFQASCHPIIHLTEAAGMVHVDPDWEADTDLDIKALLKTSIAENYDPEINYDLGGEDG